MQTDLRQMLVEEDQVVEHSHSRHLGDDGCFLEFDMLAGLAGLYSRKTPPCFWASTGSLTASTNGSETVAARARRYGFIGSSSLYSTPAFCRTFIRPGIPRLFSYWRITSLSVLGKGLTPPCSISADVNCASIQAGISGSARVALVSGASANVCCRRSAETQAPGFLLPVM